MKKRPVFIALTWILVMATMAFGQSALSQGPIQNAAEAYFGAGPRTIAAADLYENLNDGDADNDPTIISLRSAEDYAKGHVPGAVNVSVKALFTAETLATIPPDRDVVLICYTGQTAGQAAAGLNMLGYDAYSLLFGMSSWTTDPGVYVKRFDPDTHTGDYAIDTEAHEPGGPYDLPTPLAGAGPSMGRAPTPLPVADLPSAQIGASTCMACHIDQPSLQALATEEEEVASEETSGEG